VKKSGEETIKEHLKEINNEQVRKLTEERLEELRKGKRDLYF
jgi:2-iminoacetate synthase